LADYLFVIVPALIIIADLAVYMVAGIWGRRSHGEGSKYEPFTGGEDAIPQRGLYRSGLFIFAVLFMVVEGFALLLAGSFTAPTNYYPLLYLTGGGAVILVVALWFMMAGGGKF